MEQRKARIFRGFIPVAPDIAKIREKIPDESLTSDRKIPYVEIGEMIGSPYGSKRFRTVTNVWRKELLSKGIVVGTVSGEAFIVADDNLKVDISAKKFSTASAYATRSLQVAGCVDRDQIEPTQSRKLDFIENLGKRFIEAARLRSKAPLPLLDKKENG